MKKIILATFLTVTLMANSMPAFADDGATVAAAMVADAFIARPAGIVAIVLGTAAFIVALPFAAISGSVEPVANTLVADPFKFTFTRPVGDFSCWE